jgi:hypothetical protein
MPASQSLPEKASGRAAMQFLVVEQAQKTLRLIAPRQKLSFFYLF